ncbi:hypothetical protein G7Y89_g1591 [Cudoniella acicularis]|uniref:Uncharacterized protein n=1 Tax=Cudoniella acicularis TaxID=354080 RepID=A0A8H4RW14_9HELO|nr:hypothetical protein G7Y89_g1591 [Cudoniella acicularis]
MPDGSDLDGKELLTLVRKGRSPFEGVWNVDNLIRKIEEKIDTKATNILYVSKGSNNYGLHLQLPNRAFSRKLPEAEFEAAVYRLLRSEPDMPVSKLLYYRIPVQHAGPRLSPPQDILGRQLFVFEKAEGENNTWRHLDIGQKANLLAQAARIRALLCNFNLSLEFATTWLRERLFEQKPKKFPIPVAPTRSFCNALIKSKIEATIKNIGDMIS